MDRFVIQGGAPLQGRIEVSGAKNAALPAMAACLLTEEPVQLSNMPRVRDIFTMKKLLQAMGVSADPPGKRSIDTLTLHAERISKPEATYELVKTMRASFFVLGPLLARCGEARVSLPGGCAIGARPVNLHLKALEQLGAEFTVEHGYVHGKTTGLRGGRIRFDKISVGGTENAMMAATLAEGETVIGNAAREPEITDLAKLLRAMGAKIEGDGTSSIKVTGVTKLNGAGHRILPDRIETGTFILAAAITEGELQVTNCECAHQQALLNLLREAGATVDETGEGCVLVRSAGTLRAVDISTEEYPGFPTDMQAQYMALMTQAEGTSVITETIFENRFMHVLELARMGADIKVDGRRATVRGRTPLAGASVIASDLRASAGLVLAALAAGGETVIDRVYHIDRGYERIEEKLRAVGARIQRISV